MDVPFNYDHEADYERHVACPICGELQEDEYDLGAFHLMEVHREEVLEAIEDIEPPEPEERSDEYAEHHADKVLNAIHILDQFTEADDPGVPTDEILRYEHDVDPKYLRYELSRLAERGEIEQPEEGYWTEVDE